MRFLFVNASFIRRTNILISGAKMVDQINGKILEWLSWRQAAKLMREEAPWFESVPMRFSSG